MYWTMLLPYDHLTSRHPLSDASAPNLTRAFLVNQTNVTGAPGNATFTLT